MRRIVHCNTLQRAATRCRYYQAAAVDETRCFVHATHCNTLQHTATHCNTLQHTPTHCNVLQILPGGDGGGNTLYRAWQHAATRCYTLLHAATQCNTLQILPDGDSGGNALYRAWQHAATRCYTLQHTADTTRRRRWRKRAVSCTASRHSFMKRLRSKVRRPLPLARCAATTRHSRNTTTDLAIWRLK